MGKHRKHDKLSKRTFGNYATNEIAILGTKCSNITNLVQKISNKIHLTSKLAYIDASHSKEIVAPKVDNFTFHSSGNLSIIKEEKTNKYQSKIIFSNYDFVFINGNHFQANQQILIIDADKEASVLKRIDQLDNIQFIIKLNKSTPVFKFLMDKYPNLKNLKVYNISEIDKISQHVENLIQQKIASIQGLVLAGGKSLRMGTDKGLLDYHGISQRNYSVNLLESLNIKTYLSVRKEQKITDIKTIEDTFLGLGPFGAICSAFQQNPNTAWLVMATDLPFINDQIIQQLLQKRNPSKIATAIKGLGKPFPEPLITIWEPKAYPILLNFMAQGISCPRKVLINNDTEILEIKDNFIQNINTPEEYDAVKKELNV